MTFRDVAQRFIVRNMVNGKGPHAERCLGSVEFKSGIATCQVVDADGLMMTVRVTANYRSETVLFTRKELRRMGYGCRHGKYSIPQTEVM